MAPPDVEGLRAGRRNPADYIVQMTDQIWVDRGVGLIGAVYYHPEVVIHGAAHRVVGSEAVTQATLMSIAAYPDEFSRAEAVIWEPRGQDCFVSSHRVRTTATHQGHSEYGPPSGRCFAKLAIAHCLVRGGVVVEEWVVRDEYDVAQALEVDIDHAVATLTAELPTPHEPTEVPDPPRDPLHAGVSGARPAEDIGAAEGRVLEMVDQVWNGRMFQRLGEFVAPDVLLTTSRGRTFQGAQEYSTDLISLLAPFPDARACILDVCATSESERVRQVALVWELAGTYCGTQVYGPRTGRPVRILVISHFTVIDELITEEVRVFDELTVLAQIEQGRTQGRTRDTDHELSD